MLRQSLRSYTSLALSLALGVFAAAGATGCSASETSDTGIDDAVVKPNVENRRVDVSAFESLAPGELLRLDLKALNVVYRIDYSQGELDYSRILFDIEGGLESRLDQVMTAVHEGSYGDNPQPDLLAASNQRFSVARDASYFGVLTESQLAELQEVGYFYTATPKAPSASPQTTDDDCIHAICVIHLDPITLQPYNWANPPAYPPLVIEEEHVWCD